MRFRLYSGKGRKIPEPLSEEDFIDEYDSIPVAQKEAWRQDEKGKDGGVIFDTDTGDFHSTWTTGRTLPRFREDSDDIDEETEG